MDNKWNYKKLEPVPEEGIRRCDEILRSGNLFRYASKDPAQSETALFERDFLAAWGGGMRYAIAVNSGTSAIMLGLKALDVGPGSEVLVPAFTFTAVPSAVENLYATPVLVESDMNFKVDFEDLEEKIAAHPRAKVFLLSHMRGWISDMDAIMKLCAAHGITIMEDAAHALGSFWDGRLVGTFGALGTFSFQSYKIVNAGEGGMVITDNEDLAARMLFDQGAYEELYLRHLAKPGDDVLAQYVNRRPFYNMRMPNHTAAIARSQPEYVDRRIAGYEEVYRAMTGPLAEHPLIELPVGDPRERRVLDSIQFRLKGFDLGMMEAFVAYVHECGVPLEAFGIGDNARAPWNWKYIRNIGHEHFPKTHAALDTAVDMRITTSLDEAHRTHFVESVFDGIKAATGALATK